MSEEQVLTWLETVKKIISTGKLFVPPDWTKVHSVLDYIIKQLNDEKVIRLILAVIDFFTSHDDAKKLVVMFSHS